MLRSSLMCTSKKSWLEIASMPRDLNFGDFDWSTQNYVMGSVIRKYTVKKFVNPVWHSKTAIVLLLIKASSWVRQIRKSCALSSGANNICLIPKSIISKNTCFISFDIFFCLTGRKSSCPTQLYTPSNLTATQEHKPGKPRVPLRFTPGWKCSCVAPLALPAVLHEQRGSPGLRCQFTLELSLHFFLPNKEATVSIALFTS